MVQFALVGMGQRWRGLGDVVGRVQAEQAVQPAFERVPGGVANGLCQFHLLECATRDAGPRQALGGAAPAASALMRVALLAELFDQLQGEGAPGTLIPVHGAAEEDEVGPKHGTHGGERDGCGLVDDQQLGLGQPRVVVGLDVLHRLAVAPVDVGPDDGLAELRVGALKHAIVDVLLVAQLVERLEEELEQSAQVLRRGGRDEDVAVPQGHAPGDGEAQHCTLSPAAGCGECHRGAEGLLRRSVHERHQRLRLAHGAAASGECARRLCVG